MAVDSKKIRELRENARDEALKVYHEAVSLVLQPGGDGQPRGGNELKQAYEKVTPILTKIAAYDEILAMEEQAPEPVRPVLPSFTAPPPRRSQADLAAESEAEAEAAIARMDAQGPKAETILTP